MNTFTRLPVTLVLADSGPLISLAAAGRLDLLDSFDRPVRIVDVVKAECLRYPDKIGGSVLKEWFDNLDGSRYAIENTPLLDDWLDAVQAEADGDQSRPSDQLGDAALSLAISRFTQPNADAEVVLLLLEDSAYGDNTLRINHPEVYALSTRAFLKTLQNFGRIQSADAVLADILAAGRSVARYGQERPGKIAAGVRSQWTDPLQNNDEAIRRVLAEILVNHAMKGDPTLPYTDLVDSIVIYASQDQLRDMIENMSSMGEIGQFLTDYGIKLPGYDR